MTRQCRIICDFAFAIAYYFNCYAIYKAKILRFVYKIDILIKNIQKFKKYVKLIFD